MDTEGRILGIEIRTDGGKLVRILGIYAPNVETDSVRFFQQLNNRGLKGYHIIVGDMNKCEAKIDRNPMRLEDPRVLEALHMAFENNGFKDGWRLANPDLKAYTYWSDNSTCSASRIDRIYVSLKTFRKCSKWEILSTPNWTDHNAICMDFYPHDKVKRGPGLWRLNTSLLQRPEMRQGIVSILSKSCGAIKNLQLGLQNSAITKVNMTARAAEIFTRFDQMMSNIRTFAKGYQNKVSLKRNKLKLKLERRLLKYDGKTRTSRNTRKVKMLRYRLKALLEELAHKQTLFSYAKKLEAGGYESNFWKLGKDPQVQHLVPALYDKNGRLQKNPSKVLRVAKEFYTDLYSERQTDKRSQDKLLTNIMWDTELDIIQAVTREEVLKVINKWKTGSTPGPSGIPYEFFKEFLFEGSLGFDLLEVLTLLNNILFQPLIYGVSMPQTWLKGVIKLLHKKGDINDIRNYRPLSMTEALYKLVTGLINNRLLETISKRIGPHQAGFLPGRSYFDHIKHVQTIIDWKKLEGKPFYLALLDQEKAYDRVDHIFLQRILKKFGVPYNLRYIIKTAYSGATSVVMVNNFVSEDIQIKSGVRQGDPLSCTLFNLVIESLALLILSNANFIPIQDSQLTYHRLNLYADDTIIFMSDLAEWKLIKFLYNTYSKATGSALNESKTKIICVNHDTPLIPYRGVDLVTSATYLGIPIGTNLDPVTFWNTVMNDMKTKLKRWNRFTLSLRQRATICNTVIEGSLWYHIRSLPISANQIQRLQRVILRFIWSLDDNATVRGPIKNEELFKPIALGGLGLIHIGTMANSLGFYWIQRLEIALSEESDKRPLWYNMVLEILNFKMRPEIKRLNLAPWRQTWITRPPKPPASLHSFLKIQKKSEFQIAPTSQLQLASIEYWAHPILNDDKPNVRWGAPVWKQLQEGDYTNKEIKTLGELWQVKMGNIAGTTDQQRAANRLFSHLPQTWTQLITEEFGQETEWESQGIFSNKLDIHLPIVSSSTKTRYNFILKSVISDSCLLAPFRLLCLRDNVSIDSISPKQIWKSLFKPKVDYPKFADLYWKLILGVVRTGESWMVRKLCPRCNCPQVAEHLFWDCPLAKKVWRQLAIIWEQIPDEKIDFTLPNTWANLLLSGHKYSLKSFGSRYRQRRWRILFSEVLWTIWTCRCAWSFNETQTFGHDLPQKFDERIIFRAQIDRQLAASSGKANDFTTYRETWGHYVES
ncbi:Transposon tx1 uncharacterized protein [Thalictrum thalictroides]|uniref:Transposon tx1 uncharacterized protein n=1 Tax=Thalictrum thalictroides TaxID=46969 RepID=A0A7J6UZ44_THATH|nr:Transposon tx1 uncharacterized protein [Thalictrum thalictroides]